ncbi:hypothetical protein GLAREA_07207 [Glarea lozoyensis ATCC 20868]|uniref:Uncharacterized protein n=1 Tax=Glarea lozoyensis (strain ATCC 20868 / MF5171) TaxID=1116229 RepID=S3DAQ2_GLAL2|nr:uncharacterized protein GLAREA_07207 [Glarea lozoyensis ATCC 20868]EPE34194.1 hypothetical protein GLAREA_07207 [Glarea lozoyensis ATCC 20868]
MEHTSAKPLSSNDRANTRDMNYKPTWTTSEYSNGTSFTVIRRLLTHSKSLQSGTTELHRRDSGELLDRRILPGYIASSTPPWVNNWEQSKEKWLSAKEQHLANYELYRRQQRRQRFKILPRDALQKYNERPERASRLPADPRDPVVGALPRNHEELQSLRWKLAEHLPAWIDEQAQAETRHCVHAASIRSKALQQQEDENTVPQIQAMQCREEDTNDQVQRETDEHTGGGNQQAAVTIKEGAVMEQYQNKVFDALLDESAVMKNRNSLGGVYIAI